MRDLFRAVMCWLGWHMWNRWSEPTPDRHIGLYTQQDRKCTRCNITQVRKL